MEEEFVKLQSINKWVTFSKNLVGFISMVHDQLSGIVILLLLIQIKKLCVYAYEQK